MPSVASSVRASSLPTFLSFSRGVAASLGMLAWSAGALVNVGIAETPGLVQDVELAAGLAYVAVTGAGLYVVEVADPASPVGVGLRRIPWCG